MKHSSRGLIGTIIFHISILLILIFFGFSYPDPPPEEQGVLVNFGTDLTGSGVTEPKGDEIPGGNAETTPVVEEKVTLSKPETVKKKTKQPAVLKNTQSVEETKVKATKPSEEELRQIELQKIQAEELRKKKADDERRQQLTEQLNSKAKNAFGKAGVGTTAGSQGITEGTGNQGNPNGVPGVENYGEGGGLGNGTIGFGLGNRGLRGDLPKPIVEGCTVTSRVIIKVQINVDREGNVVGDPKILESNFQDDCIYQGVLKAASSAKFTVDQQAPIRQQGWIRYIIEP
jgi:hypothetical protein